MTTYSAIVQELNADVTWLTENNYNLALAKGVASTVGGDPEFNVIFSSNTIGTIANNMTVSWQETYGLNWSLDVPTKGATVKFGGNWTECDIGSGLVLDKGGLFALGTGQDGGLSLQNNFKNVCILVGVKDSKTNTWHTIFRGDNQLIIGGSGFFVPSEYVRIWYGNNQNSGTVIATYQSPQETYDMSQTSDTNNTHWFKLDTSTGKWSDQDHSFFDSDKLVGQPWRKFIKFTIELAEPVKWVQRFKFYMGPSHWQVDAVAKINGKEYEVTLKEKPKGGLDGDDPTEAVESSLKNCLDEGDFPEGETWKVTDTL